MRSNETRDGVSHDTSRVEPLTAPSTTMFLPVHQSNYDFERRKNAYASFFLCFGFACNRWLRIRTCFTVVFARPFAVRPAPLLAGSLLYAIKNIGTTLTLLRSAIVKPYSKVGGDGAAGDKVASGNNQNRLQ